MKLSKKQISAQTIFLAASIFIGSNSFVLAADTTADIKSTDLKASETKAPEAKTESKTDAAQTKTDASPEQNASASVQTDSNASTGTQTKWKPGVELSIGTDTQDLVPTDDPDLARKQAEAYPDSPEAAFIYAVALTRTSRVEEALQQVRKARRLADQKGGATYFDKMITTYEDLLKNYPKENRVRYGLGWAYYMKAYLLAQYSRKVAKWKAANPDPAKALADAQKAGTANGGMPVAPKSTDPTKAAIADAAKAAQAGKPLDIGALLGQVGALAQGNAKALPKVPEVMDGVEPADIPQIKKYFEQALTKMDELIAQKPDDVWALVYRAHLKAEYTGNIDEAMATWKACSEKFPNNPAAYFFLGEGWLKKGDLKQSINNVSKAVALRGMGN